MMFVLFGVRTPQIRDRHIINRRGRRVYIYVLKPLMFVLFGVSTLEIKDRTMINITGRRVYICT